MADMQHTLSFLRRELAGKTIEQKVVLLRSARQKFPNGGEGLTESLEIAARILEDGPKL